MRAAGGTNTMSHALRGLLAAAPASGALGGFIGYRRTPGAGSILTRAALTAPSPPKPPAIGFVRRR